MESIFPVCVSASQSDYHIFLFWPASVGEIFVPCNTLMLP